MLILCSVFQTLMFVLTVAPSMYLSQSAELSCFKTFCISKQVDNRKTLVPSKVKTAQLLVKRRPTLHYFSVLNLTVLAPWLRKKPFIAFKEAKVNFPSMLYQNLSVPLLGSGDGI